MKKNHVRMVCVETGRWTAIETLPFGGYKFTEAIDRLVAREFGGDHFAWFHNFTESKLGLEDGAKLEILRSIGGGLQEHNNIFRHFRAEGLTWE